MQDIFQRKAEYKFSLLDQQLWQENYLQLWFFFVSWKGLIGLKVSRSTSHMISSSRIFQKSTYYIEQKSKY